MGKLFEKSEHPLMIKTLNKLEQKGTLSTWLKAATENPQLIQQWLLHNIMKTVAV